METFATARLLCLSNFIALLHFIATPRIICASFNEINNFNVMISLALVTNSIKLMNTNGVNNLSIL